jgi:hypothetical protein
VSVRDLAGAGVKSNGTERAECPHSDRSQPCNDGVMTVEVPGDRPGGLAVLQPPPAFCLLMLGQLWFAAEMDTARLGGLRPSCARFTIRSRSSWASALKNARMPGPMVLGQVQVRFVENLH